MMEYQGYLGKVEFDAEAGLFHGEVIDTRDVITFQGESVAELTRAFRESVDDYLAFCHERGEAADKLSSTSHSEAISPSPRVRMDLFTALLKQRTSPPTIAHYFRKSLPIHLFLIFLYGGVAAIF